MNIRSDDTPCPLSPMYTTSSPVHHTKAGIPPFCVLVNLSYLILLGGKSSIIDWVLDSVLPPPPD